MKFLIFIEGFSTVILMRITNYLYSSHLNQAHLKAELSFYFFYGATTHFPQEGEGKEIKGFSTLVVAKESLQTIYSPVSLSLYLELL